MQICLSLECFYEGESDEHNFEPILSSHGLK